MPLLVAGRVLSGAAVNNVQTSFWNVRRARTSDCRAGQQRAALGSPAPVARPPNPLVLRSPIQPLA